MEIQYDDQKHEYRVNGVKKPCVSDILRAGGLIDSTYYTEEGRDRGKRVAAAIKDVLAMHRDPWRIYTPPVDDTLPFLRAAMSFIERTRSTVLSIEKPVYSAKDDYCGTYDAIIEWDGKVWLADWKVGGKSKFHPVQLEAYAACLGDPVKTANVYLLPTGKFSFVPHYDAERSMARELWADCLIKAREKGLWDVL